MARTSAPATVHATSADALAAKVGRQRIWLVTHGELTRYAAAKSAASAAAAVFAEMGGKTEQLSKNPRTKPVTTASDALPLLAALSAEERATLLKELKKVK